MGRRNLAYARAALLPPVSFAVLALLASGWPAGAGASSAPAAQDVGRAPSGGYLKTPKPIQDIVEAEPVPDVQISRNFVVLKHRASAPSVVDLAAPYYRLAGYEIGRITHARRNVRPYVRITVKPLGTGSEREIRLPHGTYEAEIAPDGKNIAVLVTSASGVQLFVADPQTLRVRPVKTSGLNGVGLLTCKWRHDSSGFLCWLIPDNRGKEPAALAPDGPRVLDTSGPAAQTRLSLNVFTNVEDERLFEYDFTSQLAWVELDGRTTPIGVPGLYPLAAISPDGNWLTVTHTVHPLSYVVPGAQFPADIELWDKRGKLVTRLGRIPPAQDVQSKSFLAARNIGWRADRPATLSFAQADTPNDKRESSHDRVMTFDAPFTGMPTALLHLQGRYDGMQVTETGLMLVTEREPGARVERLWILNPADTSSARQLWESHAGRDSDPGWVLSGDDDVFVAQDSDDIFVTGEGASAQGECAFLDRLNVKTGQRRRVWQCDGASIEYVFKVLDRTGTRFLTQRQTATMPPNLYVRDLTGGSLTPVTAARDPHPQLSAMKRELLTYTRKDGVRLSGTLFLPANYQAGTRLPLLLWPYPREFQTPEEGGQIRQNVPHKFRPITGASPLLMTLQGYAVLLEPSMPIVGPGQTANDRFVEQIVASAEAAVDKVVAIGVADRNRVAIGGHSYGANTAALLLAHTRLFRAGIARAGPYNRTLSPNGFQNESRTLWQAPDVYLRMSSLLVADRIKDPLLLIHGQLDTTVNPIQSELMFSAMKATGGTARYVSLPYEGHNYVARESIEHVVAEMLRWLDTYLKGGR